MKYDGNYYGLGSCIIHVKECHPQMSTATCVVHVDDYAGNVWAEPTIAIHSLNNGDVMFEASDSFMATWAQVSKDSFLYTLSNEVSKSIQEIKQNNSWVRTDWKKTDVRTALLRKHYGTKP